jgi:hypothetical protein
MFLAVVAFFTIAIAPAQAGPDTFTQVRLDAHFESYLTANPILMEFAGAKIIKLSDGRKLILSVGTTPVKDNTAQDRLRQRTVCKQKALAAILTATEGVEVYTSIKINEQTLITIENGKEKGHSVEDVLEITQSTASGIVQSLPTIGTWYSNDGGIFCLAIGGIIGTNGIVEAN